MTNIVEASKDFTNSIKDKKLQFYNTLVSLIRGRSGGIVSNKSDISNTINSGMPPGLDVVASVLTLKMVDTQGTDLSDSVAFTDGFRIYCTPLMQKLYGENLKELKFILCHEILHVAFMHFARSERIVSDGVKRILNSDKIKQSIDSGTDMELLEYQIRKKVMTIWNYATDYAINGTLSNQNLQDRFGMSRPSDALYKPEFLDMSSEQIFYKIIDESISNIKIQKIYMEAPTQGGKGSRGSKSRKSSKSSRSGQDNQSSQSSQSSQDNQSSQSSQNNQSSESSQDNQSSQSSQSSQSNASDIAKKINESIDATINDMSRGQKIIDTHLTSNQIAKLNKDLADSVGANNKEPKSEQQQQQEQGDKNGRGSQQENDKESNRKDGKNQQNHQNDEWANMSDDEREKMKKMMENLEKIITNNIRNAINMSSHTPDQLRSLYGSESGNMLEMIFDTIYEDLKVRSTLSERLLKLLNNNFKDGPENYYALADTRKMSAISKSLGGAKVYFPVQKVRTSELTIILDTSGSISQTDIKNFLNLLDEILRNKKMNIESIRLLQWDTTLAKDSVIDRRNNRMLSVSDLFEVNDNAEKGFVVKGRGGTNFDSAISYVVNDIKENSKRHWAADKAKRVVLLVTADAEGTMPELSKRQLPFKLIWVVDDHYMNYSKRKTLEASGEVFTYEIEDLRRYGSNAKDHENVYSSSPSP